VGERGGFKVVPTETPPVPRSADLEGPPVAAADQRAGMVILVASSSVT
jgi:hypothetical protein